jgi:hypothetical protein
MRSRRLCAWRATGRRRRGRQDEARWRGNSPRASQAWILDQPLHGGHVGGRQCCKCDRPEAYSGRKPRSGGQPCGALVEANRAVGAALWGTGAVLADQRSGWLRVPGREKSSSAPCETGRSWRDLQCTWNRAQASCGFACGRRLYMTVQAKFNSPGHKKSPAPRGSVRGSWAWKPEKPLEAVRGRDAVPVKSRPADGRGSGH